MRYFFSDICRGIACEVVGGEQQSGMQQFSEAANFIQVLTAVILVFSLGALIW